jgi:tetrahydromethanopterin S-methyltransferase subunit B
MRYISPLLFFVGMIGVVTLGSGLYADLMQVFYGEKGIYWTHEDMPLPLEKTGENFQIFIGGKPLQDHLDEKTFFAADGELVPYPVASKDVTVRVNNWPSAKAQILTKTTLTGFAFGVNLTLMIVGLVQTCLQRKKKASNRPRG